MAIFEIDKGKAKRVRLSEFKLEKDLQKLVENNVETILIAVLLQQNFLQEIYILDELTL